MLVNDYLHFDDPVLEQLNSDLSHYEKDGPLKIGVIYLGQQSPGGNNVVDGLLRFQAKRGNVELLGFVNGLNGLMNEKIMEINEDTFKPFRNLGGYDYVGRSHDYLRTVQEQSQAAKVCS
jgi:6-phosphofructokinase